LLLQLKKILTRYAQLNTATKYMFAAQFTLQGVHVAMFLLLNYYMVKQGFEDYETVEIWAYRFAAVMVLAFPIGLYIKGRSVKPFFWLATILMPIASVSLIYAIGVGAYYLMYGSAILWGVAYASMQTCVQPFILLNTKKELHSEAFSLSFLSFSSMIFVEGIIYFLLSYQFPDTINEYNFLLAIGFLSVIGIYFVSKIDLEENVSEKIPLERILYDYDWFIIFKAIIPTILMAVGAGFSIPVINLFFLNVHGVQSANFSLMGSMTYLMVAIVMLFIPFIRRRFGYQVAVTLFQTAAVVSLFIMSITEYFADWQYALGIAIFFYLIRQPLMNCASPMASEVVVYYVGKRNQEIIAALNASIWNGSWLLSTSIFAYLRRMEFRYVSIFLITVVLYVISIIWYWWLIRDYERRKGDSSSDSET
jgi:hypothetical protein